MARANKDFGKRNLPKKIEPKPIVYHAPQGLGGKPPRNPERLRSLAVFIGMWGVAAIGGLALVQALRNDDCRTADPNDPNTSACHSGGGGHGGGGHWTSSGGSSSSGAHSASFGGFGAIGASGAHSGASGGGHGGGGE